MFLVTICFGLVGLSPPAIGQETAPRSSVPELRHGLEGMAFSGSLAFGDETEPSDEDVLTFTDGKFSSRTCLEYGFTPAPYWVRRDADGVHFRAELHSSEHGTLHFEGVYDGKEMKVTGLWTKDRWYWTVEQKLRFTGRPVRQVE